MRYYTLGKSIKIAMPERYDIDAERYDNDEFCKKYMNYGEPLGKTLKIASAERYDNELCEKYKTYDELFLLFKRCFDFKFRILNNRLFNLKEYRGLKYHKFKNHKEFDMTEKVMKYCYDIYDEKSFYHIYKSLTDKKHIPDRLILYETKYNLL